MKLKDVLARNLQKYRKKKKISQEELAAKCEMSTRSYGKIERGEVNTSLDKLSMLAAGTKINATFLIDEEFDLDDIEL